jgi:hypothetical protein
MKKRYLILALIFLISVCFQLYFALDVNQFSSDSAYYELRHSEYITENFSPMVYDDLSYGGNYILDTHLWHYFLGILGMILPLIVVYKIIPILLASLIVFLVYLLAKQVTKSETAALFSAGISAFIPTFIGVTLNQVSNYVVYVPLMLMLLFCLMNIKRRMGWFLFLSFLIVLIDPMNFLVLFTMGIFLILVIAESFNVNKDMYEGLAFFMFLTALVNLILFKNIYFGQGIEAVWRNIPEELYSNFFRSFDIVSLVYNVGLVPLVLGFIGFGIGISKEKKKNVYLLSSVILADISLLALKLIPYDIGVMFLAIMLTISSAIAIEKIIEYLKVTKLSNYVYPIMVLIAFVAVVSLSIPAYYVSAETVSEGVSDYEIEALEWLNENTRESDIIMANVFEGNLIATVAERSNVLDTSFLYAEERYYDSYIIYTTESLYKAGILLKDYGADYLYFSDKTKEMYDIEELKYVSDENCFEKKFENREVQIYEVVC